MTFQTSVCRKCLIEKPLGEFSVIPNRCRRRVCKNCKSNRDYELYANKRLSVDSSWKPALNKIGPVVKSIVSPAVTDLYWAAGFMEGEGCFSAGSRVQASQVEIEPLKRLQSIFGGNIKKCKNLRKNQHDYYEWYATGTRGRGVALTLYLLMSGKRQKQIQSYLSSFSQYRGERRQFHHHPLADQAKQ